MQLNPKHLTLNGLLKDRLFRIPDNQRAYAWTTRQREDLFKDIEETQRSQQDHFLATVVCLARKKLQIVADEYQEVEVVDGQQRLTTFIIMLKAIEKSLSDSDGVESKLKRELSELLVKGDNHSIILLQTNHDSSQILSDYIRDGVRNPGDPETKADHNLFDASVECENFVSQWRKERKIVELVAILRNRMSLIYHELEDEATVYRVFEVLNSRGLDVKWIDKLKSQLMGLIFQNATSGARDACLDEMHVAWQDIYRILGLRGDLGDEALRFAGTLRSPNPESKVLSQEDAVGVLVASAGTELRTISEVARWLLSVVRAVHHLNGDRRLSAVTQIAHARFAAVSIKLSKFQPQAQTRVLQVWEKVTFRIFGLCDADARHKVGEYVRIGRDVINYDASEASLITRIQDIGKDYPIKDAVNEIRKWNERYSDWKEELRYLMYRYEEYLTREQGGRFNQVEWNKIWATDVSKSIEHILPQKSGHSSVHHIGNLTMLPPGLNSSLKDKSPKDKASTYKQCGLRTAAAIGEVIENRGWTKQTIIERADLIGKFIVKEWDD